MILNELSPTNPEKRRSSLGKLKSEINLENADNISKEDHLKYFKENVKAALSEKNVYNVSGLLTLESTYFRFFRLDSSGTVGYYITFQNSDNEVLEVVNGNFTYNSTTNEVYSEVDSPGKTYLVGQCTLEVYQNTTSSGIEVYLCIPQKIYSSISSVGVNFYIFDTSIFTGEKLGFGKVVNPEVGKNLLASVQLMPEPVGLPVYKSGGSDKLVYEYTKANSLEYDFPTINGVPFTGLRTSDPDENDTYRHITITAKHPGSSLGEAGAHDWSCLSTYRRSGAKKDSPSGLNEAENLGLVREAQVNEEDLAGIKDLPSMMKVLDQIGCHDVITGKVLIPILQFLNQTASSYNFPIYKNGPDSRYSVIESGGDTTTFKFGLLTTYNNSSSKNIAIKTDDPWIEIKTDTLSLVDGEGSFSVRVKENDGMTERDGKIVVTFNSSNPLEFYIHQLAPVTNQVWIEINSMKYSFDSIIPVQFLDGSSSDSSKTLEVSLIEKDQAGVITKLSDAVLESTSPYVSYLDGKLIVTRPDVNEDAEVIIRTDTSEILGKVTLQIRKTPDFFTITPEQLSSGASFASALINQSNQEPHTGAIAIPITSGKSELGFTVSSATPWKLVLNEKPSGSFRFSPQDSAFTLDETECIYTFFEGTSNIQIISNVNVSDQEDLMVVSIFKGETLMREFTLTRAASSKTLALDEIPSTILSQYPPVFSVLPKTLYDSAKFPSGEVRYPGYTISGDSSSSWSYNLIEGSDADLEFYQLTQMSTRTGSSFKPNTPIRLSTACRGSVQFKSSYAQASSDLVKYQIKINESSEGGFPLHIHPIAVLANNTSKIFNQTFAAFCFKTVSIASDVISEYVDSALTSLSFHSRSLTQDILLVMSQNTPYITLRVDEGGDWITFTKRPVLSSGDTRFQMANLGISVTQNITGATRYGVLTALSADGKTLSRLYIKQNG